MLNIKIHHLSRNFKETCALRDLTLHFPPEKIIGLIGPEGAGKTTLIRHLMQLLKAQQGSISYFRKDQEVSFESIKEHLAYMPQKQTLYADLSIDEHLEFFKNLYQLPKAIYEERRTRLLQITRLSEFAQRPAGKLSGGMYKKLGLMCALLQSPQILFLDEPTNGVDPISRKEFWGLLKDIQNGGSKILIILSTAYMDEAARCDEVLLLDQGKLIGQGQPLDLLQKAGVKTFDEYYCRRS
jgi:ABC-2 type transport system ATP-binding protein